MKDSRLTERISKLIQGKRVLVLGYGREGRSTFRVLTETGGYACVDIADNAPGMSGSTIAGKITGGDSYMDNLNDYDVVFKSPGIVLPEHFADIKYKITSQTEVFLSAHAAQTVGITGTKGKSTVAALLHHTLETAKRETILAGNIGIPLFDIADRITPGTVIVAELSCHQLEYCKESPSIAALLNIYQDHLDHYGTYELYIQAKTNIFKNQTENNILYTNHNSIPIKIQTKSKVYGVTESDLPFKRFEDIDVTRLRGQHNLLNAAFVLRICENFDINSNTLIDALKTYIPLPHRLEYIGNYGGVDYYDDSISTTAESTIKAVESIANVKTLIVGGMERGIDYEILIDFLLKSNLELIIGMYSSGERIRKMYLERGGNETCFIYAGDLYEAVKISQEKTEKNTACVLSPASASYGDFKNFEERGEVFQRLVRGRGRGRG